MWIVVEQPLGEAPWSEPLERRIYLDPHPLLESARKEMGEGEEISLTLSAIAGLRQAFGKPDLAATIFQLKK